MPAHSSQGSPSPQGVPSVLPLPMHQGCLERALARLVRECVLEQPVSRLKTGLGSPRWERYQFLTLSKVWDQVPTASCPELTNKFSTSCRLKCELEASV